MELFNDSLFSYLPHDYRVVEWDGDEDELYGTAHNIVISATQYASAVTGIPFEDWDEYREEAIEYVIHNLIKRNDTL